MICAGTGSFEDALHSVTQLITPFVCLCAILPSDSSKPSKVGFTPGPKKAGKYGSSSKVCPKTTSNILSAASTNLPNTTWSACTAGVLYSCAPSEAASEEDILWRNTLPGMRGTGGVPGSAREASLPLLPMKKAPAPDCEICLPKTDRLAADAPLA